MNLTIADTTVVNNGNRAPTKSKRAAACPDHQDHHHQAHAREAVHARRDRDRYRDWRGAYELDILRGRR